MPLRYLIANYGQTPPRSLISVCPPRSHRTTNRVRFPEPWSWHERCFGQWHRSLVRHIARARRRLPCSCLPYAGAGASAFHRWRRAHPTEIELQPLQLPGRENRIAAVGRFGMATAMATAQGIYTTIVQVKVPQRYHGRVSTVNRRRPGAPAASGRIHRWAAVRPAATSVLTPGVPDAVMLRTAGPPTAAESRECAWASPRWTTCAAPPAPSWA